MVGSFISSGMISVYTAINKGYTKESCTIIHVKKHARGKKVIPSGCIGIKKFIFGVAMADSDANATPIMNFFHLKSVSLPGIYRLGVTQTV